MVETREALENIDDIASVVGLDMIFVGTGDLRLSLTGNIGFDSDEKQLEVALDVIFNACREHQLIAGLFTASPDYADQMVKRGLRFVTVKTDTMILCEYAQQIVSDTRARIE